MPTDVFEALEQEYEALEAMLESADREAWTAPSLCPGWSVADVVLHLAQTDESLLMSTGNSAALSNEMSRASRRSMGTIDDVVEEWVSSERNRSPEEHFARRELGLMHVDPAATIVKLLHLSPPPLVHRQRCSLEERLLAEPRL